MITRQMLSAAMAMVLVCAVSAADRPDRTGPLFRILQSEASLFEKARACQQLGEIGSGNAVPALAALLPDERLSAYARSGLEGIPDPSAAAALREAIARLKGPLLIGVINSLAVLRDPQAVDLLRPLALDPDSGAAREALLALGSIASPPSIRILEQALATGPDALRAEAAAACLLAADRQRAEGELDQSRALYDLIRQAEVPVASRVGATRGAILSRKADRAPFLIEQLRSDELALRNAALLTIREIADEALAAALNTELSQAKPELRQPLLLALVDCHNRQSISTVAALAEDPNPEIRKTALEVLGRLGPEAAPALLAALQKDLAADDKPMVLNGLKAWPGHSVDQLLVKTLRQTTRPGLRMDLIRLLADRGATTASQDILKQAGGPDRAVSLAALSALQSLAGVGELPGLMALIKSSQDRAVRDAAENALASACGKPGVQEAGGEAVLAELQETPRPEEKNRWIRILATAGYAKALPALEAAAGDPIAEVADNALAQLGRWPDPAPMETLLQAMKSAASPALRKRALDSVIDLAATAADEAQRPEEVIVEWLQRARTSAPSPLEQRRILGILGRLKTVQSFQLMASCLEDPDLRTEAAAGLVKIAPAVADETEPGALAAALEKIEATVANADLQRQARQAAKTIAAQGAAARLFDGHSLAGWEGNTNVWRVRDQVMVGGSMEGNPRNEFLATTRLYTNFVLRLDYKLVGTEGFVNGGVQFRSARVSQPPNEMRGYQADIGAGYSGCLYDESRRNTFLVRADEAAIQRIEKAGDWNRYEIRCQGAHIQLWLNGVKTVDYTETDPTIPQTGSIALQIHGDCKAVISFRNITIREF